MKKTLLFALMLIFSSAYVFTSCTDKIAYEELEVVFNGGEQSAYIANDVTTYPLSMISSEPWTLEVAGVAGVVVSETSGVAGNFDLTVTLPKNETADDRTAEISVLVEGFKRTFKLTQRRARAVVMTPNEEQKVTYKKQTLKVELSQNLSDLSVQYVDNINAEKPKAISWIALDEFKDVKTKGMTKHTATFEIAANSGAARTGYIVFFDGENDLGYAKDYKNYIKVSQAKGDDLRVLTPDYAFDHNAGEVEFVMETNYKYKVVIAKEDNWISQVLPVETKAVVADTMKFQVAAFTEGKEDIRTGKINIKNETTGEDNFITVKQGKEGVLVANIPAGLSFSDVFMGNYWSAKYDKIVLTGTLADDDFSEIKRYANEGASIDLSGLKNTVLPKDAFSQMNLSDVVLPAKLAEIGEVAFYRTIIQDSLLQIPATVTKIGKYSFFGLNMSGVTLPKDYKGFVVNFKDIPERAFAAFKLTDNAPIILGEKVVNIGKEAFRQNMSIKDTLTITDKYVLGEGAFQNTAITFIKLHKDVKVLPKYVFSYTNNLEGAIDLSNVTTISEGAFYGAAYNSEKGVSFKLGKDLTTIEKLAFAWAKLSPKANLEFGDKVATIGEAAYLGIDFDGVTVTFGTGIKSVEKRAFNNAKNLKVVCKAAAVPAFAYDLVTKEFAFPTDAKQASITVLKSSEKAYKENAAITKYFKEVNTVEKFETEE